MRVLVTGAAGMLGTAVTDTLRGAGHYVVAVDRAPAPSADEQHVGDAADPILLDAALRDVDAVVHLAAIPSPERHPATQVFANNTQATHAVLERAGQHGVRKAAFASSLSALGLAFGPAGLSPSYVPVDEDHPSLAQDPYALSKLVDETTAAAMHRRHGTSTIALRFPFIGAGERLERRRQAVHDEPSTGSRELWAWLHTDHAARAVLAALDPRVTGHHVLNVAAPDTLADLPTTDLLTRHHPHTEIRRLLPGRTSPISSDRAKALLPLGATLT